MHNLHAWVLLELVVQRDNVQRVELLALIFVNAFDLLTSNIEVGLTFTPVAFSMRSGQYFFVRLLNLSPFCSKARVVGELF